MKLHKDSILDVLLTMLRAALHRSVTGYFAGLLSVSLLTAVLLPLRERLNILSVALLFLVIIAAVSTIWGWGPGLFISLVSNLIFNFFFVPPYHTFTVQEPQNVLALAFFLGAAAFISYLAAELRKRARQAEARERDSAILYDLSRLIIANSDSAQTLAILCERAVHVFALRSCAVLLPRDNRLQPVAGFGLSRDDALDSPDERAVAAHVLEEGKAAGLGGGRARIRLRRSHVRSEDVVRRGGPILYLPLRAGATTLGVLRVTGRSHKEFNADQTRLLQAFADQAALVVQRAALAEEAARVAILRESDQLKTALLSSVSHDLRTPLATIKAYTTSLLQTDVAWEPETCREFLRVIDEETDYLTRLVSNLLDMSRIEAGALRPEKEWNDVADLVSAVVERLKAVLARHCVFVDLPTDLPLVRFDFVQMEQVLTNLLENAAKYSAPGSEIRIAARAEEGWLRLSVSDQGPGIPPDQLDRIFDKFYRVRGSERRAKGMGMGLAVAKGIVEAHGGRIWAESGIGRGSTFLVLLPVEPQPQTPVVAGVGFEGR